MSLRAPIAVPVEVRADARRVFRLAWNVGEDGLRLVGRLPFENGRPVEARFGLPAGETLALRARVRSGGLDGDDEEAGELTFVEPDTDTRMTLHRYVADRLGLPG